MNIVRSSALRALTILFVTGLSTAVASETPASRPISEEAAHSPEEPLSNVCSASTRNQCGARESFNNAVVLEQVGSVSLAILYLEEVKVLLNDPSDSLYQRAQSKLQALKGLDRVRAGEDYNNGVVLQKANNDELAIVYFTRVMELVGDSRDPLYMKAERRLAAVTKN